ncbi:MAG: hypothetical protein K2W95_27555 [Candidatus Obscuribacterales bacterium]|nr:hypothetical protein [Candidatus Obscuribacterales bacterium]
MGGSTSLDAILQNKMESYRYRLEKAAPLQSLPKFEERLRKVSLQKEGATKRLETAMER